MITIKKRHEIAFGDDVKVFVRGLTAAEYLDFLTTVKAPAVPLATALAKAVAATPENEAATDADADADAVARATAEVAVPLLPQKLQPATVRAILKGVVGGVGFMFEEYDENGRAIPAPVPSESITGDFLMDNTEFALVDAVLNKIMLLTNMSAAEKKNLNLALIVIHNGAHFNCLQCTHRQCATGKPLKTPMWDAPPDDPHNWRICPKPAVVVDTVSLGWYNTFKAWKNGIAPDAGGYGDQLNKNIEALQMIENFIAAHELDLANERNRKARENVMQSRVK